MMLLLTAIMAATAYRTAAAVELQGRAGNWLFPEPPSHRRTSSMTAYYVPLASSPNGRTRKPYDQVIGPQLMPMPYGHRRAHSLPASPARAVSLPLSSPPSPSPSFKHWLRNDKSLSGSPSYSPSSLRNSGKQSASRKEEKPSKTSRKGMWKKLKGLKSKLGF